MRATSEETKDKVVELYQSLGRIKLVVPQVLLNEKTIRNILKERRISTTSRELRNKKYHLNEHYLDVIDSHEKACVLGFIFGDGNIRKLSSGYALRIELNSDDEEVLVKIRDAFCSNAPIKRRTRIRKGTTTYSSYLVLCSKHLYYTLKSYGISEDKTFDCNYPEIPEEFDCSFILGLNDADGHISIDKENRVEWKLICTTSMGTKIHEILLKHNIINRLISNQSNSQELTNLLITRKNAAIQLKKYLYSFHSGYLTRKSSVFNEIRYKRND